MYLRAGALQTAQATKDTDISLKVNSADVMTKTDNHTLHRAAGLL